MIKFEWEYNNTGGASITHKGKLYTVLPSMSDGAFSAFQDDDMIGQYTTMSMAQDVCETVAVSN